MLQSKGVVSKSSTIFFTPVIKDGVKVAVCSKEEVNKTAASWERVLIGYFIGLRPYIPTLAAYFKKIW